MVVVQALMVPQEEPGVDELALSSENDTGNVGTDNGDDGVRMIAAVTIARNRKPNANMAITMTMTLAHSGLAANHLRLDVRGAFRLALVFALMLRQLLKGEPFPVKGAMKAMV